MNRSSIRQPIAPSPSRPPALILATALLFATFVLRMAALERLPLHFDEGINVFFGHRSPAEVFSITRATFDNDPPGHRFALGIWMALAGPSPLAIRMLSVLSGMLMVAVTYRLMREFRLTDAASAVIAGLVALSPFAIEYTQQAKGYALGAAMALLSWWAWARLFDAMHAGAGRTRARRWSIVAAYIASTALALSTHYYVIPLLAMQWLWFAGTRLDLLPALKGWRPRDALRAVAEAVFRPQALRGLAMQLTACIPIGLWIALQASDLFAGMMRSSSEFQPVPPLELAGRIVEVVSIGSAASGAGGDTLMAAIAVLVTALAIGGAVQLWKQGGQAPVAPDGPQAAPQPRAAFWFGASFALLAAGSILLQQRVTFFWPRFLLYALPNLCALIGGLALHLSLRKLNPGAALRIAGLGAYVILCVAGAFAFYRAPVDAQNDYRPLVSAARPLILKGDAALGTYIWMEGMFTSYAPETRGALHWYGDPVSATTVDEHMAPIARSHPRVWSLNFNTNPDAPDNLPVMWLKQHAALAGRFGDGATQILVFDTTGTPGRG